MYKGSMKGGSQAIERKRSGGREAVSREEKRQYVGRMQAQKDHN